MLINATLCVRRYKKKKTLFPNWPSSPSCKLIPLIQGNPLLPYGLSITLHWPCGNTLTVPQSEPVCGLQSAGMAAGGWTTFQHTLTHSRAIFHTFRSSAVQAATGGFTSLFTSNLPHSSSICTPGSLPGTAEQRFTQGGGVIHGWQEHRCRCRAHVQIHFSKSPDRHITKLQVITLRHADAPLLTSPPRAEWTYLVFMPSPIFEFRRAVHGSPSVFYHPTENLHISSARLIQAAENKAALREGVFTCNWAYSIEKKNGYGWWKLLLRLRRTNYAPEFLPSLGACSHVIPTEWRKNKGVTKKKKRGLRRSQLHS